jgi:hypothetical protein
MRYAKQAPKGRDASRRPAKAGVFVGCGLAVAVLCAAQNPGLAAVSAAEAAQSPPNGSLAQPSAVHAAHACETATFSAPAGSTIVSVRSFETPVQYCRLDGYVTTTNPGPNRVNFMVALPQNFNGRYAFTIQGGAAGFVPDPFDPYLKQGYVVASTDKGTRPANILDFGWRNDPAQATDYDHRGVHVSALATQALTLQYYGNRKIHRYAMGCSGGGHGTMSAAEMHPSDFDGYIPGGFGPGAPPGGGINVIWGLMDQRLSKDSSGWISPEELTRIEKVIMDQYDSADGAVDGLIRDPSVIKLDRQKLGFLNEAQFANLQLVAGANTGGSGYWLGNASGLSNFLFGTKRPPWGPEDSFPQSPAGLMVIDSGIKAIYGPKYDFIQSFDFSSAKQLAEYRERATKGQHVFDPRNLSEMEKLGGKLIMWIGASDQAVAPQGMIDYVKEGDRVFGQKERESFFRAFTVPGMFHCSGGVDQPTDVPDVLLEAAVQWVEHGKAPDSIVVSNRDVEKDLTNDSVHSDPHAQKILQWAKPVGGTKVSRTYRLCPWPQKSVFEGGPSNPKKFSVYDSANWACEA